MRLQEAADQCFVLLNRHASLLLIANSRLSPTGWQHEHDATQRGLAHRAQAYSPKCPEGEFCELRFDGVLRSSRQVLTDGILCAGGKRPPASDLRAGGRREIIMRFM